MLSSNRGDDEVFDIIQRLTLSLISYEFNLVIVSLESEFFSFCGSKSYRSRNPFLYIARLRPIGLLQQHRFSGQIRVNEVCHLSTLGLMVDDDHPFVPVSGLLEDNIALHDIRNRVRNRVRGGSHRQYLLNRSMDIQTRIK
jgi:hypothetical protein